MNNEVFDKTVRIVLIVCSVVCLIWFNWQMVYCKDQTVRGLVVAGVLANYFMAVEMYWRSK